MPPVRLITLVALGAIAAGCASRPRSAGGSGALTVFDYNGAAGFGKRVQYDGRVVSIVPTSDFEGAKERMVWTRTLSPAERAFLDERIEKLPIASLKDEYRNPGVWDGLQLYFDVRQSGKGSRSIAVANEYVEELAVLCDGLNALLPPRHRIRYREWKELKDEMDREVAR